MDKLLDVRDLKTYFKTDFGTVRAVDGVSFDIKQGGIKGIVGESGCGKSVTARAILRILASSGRIVSGNIFFKPDEREPVDLAALDSKDPVLRSIRGKEIAMIFQEPMTAFSPVYTIGNQVVEAIRLHQTVTKAQARERAIAILQKVGIPDANSRIDLYPHQLSGGMRQRAMIAMALSCNPKLLIADEPTTALDVTIQAQIMDLMIDLQREFGMAIMIITHDLGVIAEMADEVAVMYLGRVVEQAPVGEIFRNPKHPYTQSLLKSIPRIEDDRKGRLAVMEGAVPDAYSIPPGCPFHTRCPKRMDGRCDSVIPTITKVSAVHEVSCLLYEEDRR
jgi:peptide/nickel transport system ATP-binding protein